MCLLLAVVVAGCSSDEQIDPVTGTRSERSKTTLHPKRVVGDSSHEHVEGPIDYSQTVYQLPDQAPAAPPVGGPHNPKWLRCGVYDRPVPNEYAVHSLERGAAWVTYRPDLPAKQVAKLATIPEQSKNTQEYALVSPHEGIPAPIVVASWGSWRPFESAFDPILPSWVEFISGDPSGGKHGAPCRTGGLTPEEAEQELDEWCRRNGTAAPACASRVR